MFKKYLQEVIQTLFNESLKQHTKQSSVKYAKFGIRQSKALIKPEMLSISGNNERNDSQKSADSLKLRQIFEAVFKKFINPKLDLMATLEQIRAMETNRREEMLKSLGAFFKFESRSRLPALPPANASQASDAKTAPVEFSTGWTGQPTVKTITCNVETSSPRGIDYAILDFAGCKETEKFHPAQSKPLAVRLRKARGRSNKRSRRKKKISTGKSPTLEFSKVYTDNKGIADVDETVHSSNAEHLAPDVKELNVKEHNLETVHSPMKSLGAHADVQYKHSGEKSCEFYRKLKEGIQDKISGFIGLNHTKMFDFEPDTRRSLVKSSDSGQRRDDPLSIPGNQTKSSGCNLELERTVGGTQREIVVVDEQNGHGFYNVNVSGVDSNNTDLLVEHKDTPARELLRDAPKIATGKGSTSKKDKYKGFQIPKQLIKSTTGDFVKSLAPSKQNKQEMEKLIKKSLSDLVKVSGKSIFASIETNNPISYRGGNKYKKTLSNKKAKAKRYGLIDMKHKNKNEVTENKKFVSFTIENKTALEGEKNKSVIPKQMKFMNHNNMDLNEEVSAAEKKENDARKTKSENNLSSERKIRTPRKRFSKSSLKKLKTKQVTTNSSYLKQKAWFKDSYKKIADEYKSNVNKKSNSKDNLPKVIKVQESGKDILMPKSVNFKAGNYMPRSKHFLKERFPSVERLNLSKRNVLKVSPSKRSLDLRNSMNEIGKSKAPSLLKQASQTNVVISSVGSQKHTKAHKATKDVRVKGKKRTKVISNSIASLTMLSQKSVSIKDAIKKGLNTSRSKLSGFTSLKRSKVTPLKKEISGTLQNKLNTKTNNLTNQTNTKQTNIMKTMADGRSQLKTGKRTNIITTVIESNADKVKTPGHTLKVSKVRKTHPRKPEAKIVLKMYARGKENASIANPAHDMRNKKSYKKVMLENRLGLSKTNRISSNSTEIRKTSLEKTNSAKVSKSLPVINVHQRSFSTVYNNSGTLQVKRNRSVSPKTSKSTPVIINIGPYKRKHITNLFETSLGTRIRRSLNIPLVKNKIPIQEEYHKQNSWLTINDEAKKSYQNCTSSPGLAPSEGGKKERKANRKRSLQRKRSNILKFKKQHQVITSRLSDNSSAKKELNVEVLYNSSKPKGIDSKINIHVPSISKKLSSNKLKFKSAPCSTQVSNENVFPPQMIQNVVDKCINRANLRSLKVLVSPTAEIVEGNKPRRWKSKDHRLNKLQSYKNPQLSKKCVLNLNHQLTKTLAIKTSLDKSNQHLAHCKPVNRVVKLNTNLERLVGKVDKFKFPMHPETYNSKIHLPTTDDKSSIDNLGMHETLIISEKVRQSRKGAMKINGKNNGINNDRLNTEITKTRDDNDKKSNILFGTEGKINLALLKLDELVKSQVSKSLPRAHNQSTSDKIVKKAKLTVHHKVANNDSPSKVRNDRPLLINGIQSIASSKGNLILDNYMTTIFSELVTKAKNAESSKSKSQLRGGDGKNQPVKPLLEENKPLKSVMKHYKPKTSTKKEAISCAARSVNNTNLPTNTIPNELQIEANFLPGIKTTQNVNRNVIGKGKPVKLDKNLYQLGKIMTDNQITKEFTPIRSLQVPITKNNKNDTKVVTLPRGANKTAPSDSKTTHSLKVSKSCDNQVNNNQSKVPRKFDKLDGNNDLFKIKSEEYLNKNIDSSKSFKSFLSISKGKNKHLLRDCYLKSTGTTKNLPAEYDKKLPGEKKRLTHNQADLSKIRTKLKNDPSKHSKETPKTTDTIIASNPHTLDRPINYVRRHLLGYKHKSNKITEGPCNVLAEEKSATTHALKYAEENLSTRSVSVKPTRNLLLGFNEPKPLLLNKGPNKPFSKFKAFKCMDIRECLLAPNISKDIVMLRSEKHSSNSQFESNEWRSTGKNKLTAETIATSTLSNHVTANGIQQNEMKSCAKTATPVKSGKATESKPLSSSFMVLEKLKNLEQWKDGNIQNRHPIEQINSFLTSALKLDPTKNQFDKNTDKQPSLVSENKSENVMNLSEQNEHRNCENAVYQETKPIRQKTHVVIGKKAHKENAKIGKQEKLLSCDKNDSSVTGWDGNFSLEPGFI